MAQRGRKGRRKALADVTEEGECEEGDGVSGVVGGGVRQVFEVQDRL